MSLQVIQIINSPIPSNCFIVFDKEVNNNCLIIDPGSESNELLENKLNEFELIAEYIILTHEHFDHCWGVNQLREKHNVKLICSADCSEAIQQEKKNMSLFYNQVGFKIKRADIIIENINNQVSWNKYTIESIVTKGHTSASICIIIEENLFTGDSLIKGMKIITKLPTGSKEEFIKSIKQFMNWKGYGFIVYPGHGEIFNLDNYDVRAML
ncbi:MAG: MBL fold metallo-hydrolase [Anaerovoracaceae bacterium]